MSDALDAVTRELETTPRHNERIVLDPASWSDDDKRQVFEALMDAARAGDSRVPAALSYVVSGPDLEDALEELAAIDDPPGVAIEAAWELHTLARGRLYASIHQGITSGRLHGSVLRRALALLLQQSEASGVAALLDATQDEQVRTVIIEALWRHARLDLFPGPVWTGLQAFRRALMLPFASFRASRLDRFKRLLMTDPLTEGFAVRDWELPPPALATALQEVNRGRGPAPAGANLTEEERQGLLLHAAEQAVGFAKPRGLETLANLAGNAHRDVLEWAQSHPSDEMRAVAAAALAKLDNPA